MIPRNQLYVLDYYKKNTYMGSDGPLYYRIYRAEITKEEPETEAALEVVCWPGPFIYDKTPEEQKHYKRFDYSEEGMEQIILWLHQEKQVLSDSKERFLQEEYKV